jgi:hypothetical protein
MGKGRKAGEHFVGLKRISLAPEVAFGNAFGWQRTIDFDNEPPYHLDVTFLQPCGRLGEALAAGLFSYCRDKRRATITNVRTKLKLFSKYISYLVKRGDMPLKPDPADLTSHLAAGFAHWLTPEGNSGYSSSIISAKIAHSGAMQVVRAAQASPRFREEFAPGLRTHSNPLGWSGSTEATAERSQPLEVVEYRAVRSAAAKEALAIINDPFRPLFPTRVTELLPFWLLLLIDTTTNTSSVSQLTRNCIEPHVFDNKISLITFPKARGGSGENEEYQFQSYENEDPLSPCNIIRFLLNWTEPLVGEAPAYHRNHVFIYRPASGGERLEGGGRSIINQLTEKLISTSANRAGESYLRQFCLRHRLDYFQPRKLRETGAYYDWLRHRSIFRIKLKLNHTSIRTSGLYLQSTGIREAAVEEISEGVAAMTEAYMTRGKPVIREVPLEEAVKGDPRLTDEAAAKILGGSWHTGLGECANPYESPLPNQKRGHLCSAFWACIWCSNAIFTLEHLPLLLARKKSVIEYSTDMNPALWNARFGRIANRLEVVIGHYSEAAVCEAEKKVTAAHLVATRSDVITQLKIPMAF